MSLSVAIFENRDTEEQVNQLQRTEGWLYVSVANLNFTRKSEEQGNALQRTELHLPKVLSRLQVNRRAGKLATEKRGLVVCFGREFELHV